MPFFRHGASYIQMGVRRTLHLPSDAPIRESQMRLAGLKWAAVGGSAAASLVEPALATVIGAGTGVFLLLDPYRPFSVPARVSGEICSCLEWTNALEAMAQYG
jgi:hypothetical protein